VEVKFGGKHKKRDPEVIEAADFIAVKSYKAKGKRLTNFEVASINELEPIRFKEPEPQPEPPSEETEPPVEKPDLPEGGDTGEQMSLF
jgi:topoisomerase-4 subunit A